MCENIPITWERKQKIIAALEKDAHALRAARAGRCELCDGVADRGPQRDRVGGWARDHGTQAAAEAACGWDRTTRANPHAPQNEIAQLAGVSRSSVRRIEGDGRRRRGGQAQGRRAEWRICRQM
jgi:DNA-binding XRE family transcriptional regulator